MNYVRTLPYYMSAKYNGKCSKCNQVFIIGDRILYFPRTKSTYYADCATKIYNNCMNILGALCNE